MQILVENRQVVSSSLRMLVEDCVNWVHCCEGDPLLCVASLVPPAEVLSPISFGVVIRVKEARKAEFLFILRREVSANINGTVRIEYGINFFIIDVIAIVACHFRFLSSP